MFKSIMNNKKAFTLAEVMVVLTVIGIVAAATMKITSSQINYAKKFLYYASYSNLKSAAGEIYANGSTDTGTFKKSLPASWNINTATVQNMGLCQRFLELFNTIGNIDCSIQSSGPFTGTPDFVMANGARIFYGANDGVNYTLYVDINGLKGKAALDDDVLKFIVSLSASVSPASDSVAYDNTDYISASVKYDKDGTTTKVLNGVSYVRAECAAGLLGGPYPSPVAPCGNAGITCYVEVNKPGF